MTDLSAYELARLENIRRNQEELARLGLASKAQRDADRRRAESVARAARRVNQQKRKRVVQSTPNPGTRRSKRLRGIKPDGSRLLEADELNGDDGLQNGSDEESTMLDYDIWPRESAELDSKEFLIYVKLRAWRLMKKNELECEPYKICQNRTLCEMIRRRRNDQNWAQIDSPSLETELVECWGVGPAKAADTPKGFGRMLLQVMEEDKDIPSLFEQSRREPED